MVWYTRLSKLAAATSSSSSTLFKKLITQNHPITTLLKPKHSFSNHFGGYKSPPLIKHYHTYENQGPKWHRKIIKTLSSISLFVIPFGTLVYIAYSETIPYTNRSHFVLVPPSEDKFLAEIIMFELKDDELVVLPEEHPDSVRVKSIGEQIVKALESDLEGMKGKKLTVDHLVGLKWEFLVVNDTKDTGVVPGGKIHVSSDLLKHLESDAEIAIVIGHEVGHVVARHGPRRLNMLVLATLANKYLGLPISSILKMAEHIPHGLLELGRVLFTYPGWRREEREADYIGLLLMASAGFDPQEAPKVCAMLDQRLPPSSKSHFYQTHPSGKNRAKYLSKPKVMEEAKSIYSKTIGTRKMNDIKDR